MDFERRLKNHLTEQADGIEIETAEANLITDRAPKTRGTVTTLAAVVVVLAAAAGFWMLSSGEKGAVNEIAAGESGEVDATGTPVEAAAHIPLEVIDVSSENSPGFGRVQADNGVYYVLSTAPGQVSFNDRNLTDEQYMEIYRQNTFYVFDEETGWTVNQFDDRFVSDFDVNDGVLYVVSTGSKTGAPAAFGNSTDRGQTWTWTEIDDLPEVDQLAMLNAGDQTVLFASRWGYPEYEEVLKAAADGGIEITDFNLRDFNHTGLSYIEIDPADRCAAVEAQYLPNIAEFRDWMQSEEFQAEAERSPDIELEYDSMLQWIRDEFANNNCDWNEDWESIETIPSFEFPEPVFKTWEEIGFTPPESWQTWATTYLYDGEKFNDVGKPFDDSFQVGGAFVTNGELTVSVWDNTAIEEEFEGEIMWRTSNGLDWEQEIRRYDQYEEDDAYYYDPFYPEPRAGDFVYRIWWDETAYMEEMAVAESEAAIATEVVATTVVESDSIGDEEATEETMEEFYADGDYAEPEPMLQRRIGTSDWETVSLAEIAPDIDVGDRMIHDVRGTPLGVFLIYGNSFRQNGPPESGITVVYSNNGVDWDSFDLKGNSVETYGNSPDEVSDLLLFSNTWAYDEAGKSSTQTVLVRPAG